MYELYQPERRGSQLLATLSALEDRFGAEAVPPDELTRNLVHGIQEYLRELGDESRARLEQIGDLRRTMAQREERSAYYMIELKRQLEQRDRTIEAIMQGRVMRLMTGIQRRLRRISE